LKFAVSIADAAHTLAKPHHLLPTATEEMHLNRACMISARFERFLANIAQRRATSPSMIESKKGK
jgi:hypothetical protein